MKEAQSLSPGQVGDKHERNFFSETHTRSNSSFSNKGQLIHTTAQFIRACCLSPLVVLLPHSLCLLGILQFIDIPTSIWGEAGHRGRTAVSEGLLGRMNRVVGPALVEREVGGNRA